MNSEGSAFFILFFPILFSFHFCSYVLNFIPQYLLDFEFVFIIYFSLLSIRLLQSQTNILTFDLCLILQVSNFIVL
jgi:hypothetical protein